MPTIARDPTGEAHRITKKGTMPESDCGLTFDSSKLRTVFEPVVVTDQCEECEW